MMRSKFMTTSCSRVIALFIPVANAGVRRPWRMSDEKYVFRNSAISTGTFESAAWGFMRLPVNDRAGAEVVTARRRREKGVMSGLKMYRKLK